MADNYQLDVDKFLHKNEELLEKVDRYVRTAESKNNKNRLLLCMSQIQKILKLLIEVTPMKEANLFGLKEIIKYLGKRLEWCVDECEKVLTKRNDASEDESCYGRFVQLVDRALLLISEGLSCNDSEIKTWKPVIEDILCQSLIIAGMAGGIDYEEITAGCHKVLAECNRIEEEYKGSVATLQSNFLADWILQLERRVSKALLRLVLKTFSDPSAPLKRLVLAIDGLRSDHLRTPLDLDEIVDSFDSHSDCIQHIASFALACSEYSKNVLKIRCCLASLESLDDSLVPAAMALYMDRKHPGKRLLLKFLASVWLNEVKSLETHLDCIMDSTTFTAVAFESAVTLLQDEVVADSVENKNASPLISILLQAAKLERHLELNAIKNNLITIMTECSIALNLWMKNAKDRHGRPVTLKRVMSRFQVLLQMMSVVLNQLSEDMAKKDLSFPDSIRDLTIDKSSSVSLRSDKICKATSKLESSTASLRSLKVISEETSSLGSQNAKESSMLLKLCNAVENTPSDKILNKQDDDSLLHPYRLKATKKCVLPNTLYAPSPRRVKRTPIAAIGKPCDFDRTLALDLTDILERFADDSQATLSTIDYSHRSGQSRNHCVVQIENGASSFPDLSGICQLESSLSQFTIDSGMFGERADGSSVITLDRLNDLKKLDERIEYLKEIANA